MNSEVLYVVKVCDILLSVLGSCMGQRSKLTCDAKYKVHKVMICYDLKIYYWEKKSNKQIKLRHW